MVNVCCCVEVEALAKAVDEAVVSMWLQAGQKSARNLLLQAPPDRLVSDHFRSALGQLRSTLVRVRWVLGRFYGLYKALAAAPRPSS